MCIRVLVCMRMFVAVNECAYVGVRLYICVLICVCDCMNGLERSF